MVALEPPTRVGMVGRQILESEGSTVRYLINNGPAHRNPASMTHRSQLGSKAGGSDRWHFHYWNRYGFGNRLGPPAYMADITPKRLRHRLSR